MPILAVCPNPDCGADIMIPRRIGAQVHCDECDTEWVVEEFDPPELIPVDDELDDWDEEEEEVDIEEFAAPTASGLGASTSAAAVAAVSSQAQWECSECGMLHLGARAPRKCPGCGASGDHFNLLSDEPADDFADEPLDDEDEEL